MEKNIILLHGWGAETRKLLPLKDELEKLGWSVLVPKLVGFEKPAPKTIWGIKEYSDYVYQEARANFGKSKFFVFGHSFGGGIAIKMAVAKKNKLSGIILCASRGISRGKKIKRMVFTVLAKTGKLFLITPYLALNFKRLLYKAAHEHDYEKTQGIMRDIFKKVVSEDLNPIIAKIKQPTLILWGKLDKMTPIKDAYKLNKSINNSKLITFREDTHRLPYSKPYEIAVEIETWYQSLN